MYQCTSSKKINIGNASIQRTFTNDDCSTVGSTRLADASLAGESFVAYRSGVCIKPTMLDKDSTDDYTMMFGGDAILKGGDYAPWMHTYGNDHCDSKAFSEPLPGICEDAKPNYGNERTAQTAWSYSADTSSTSAKGAFI